MTASSTPAAVAGGGAAPAAAPLTKILPSTSSTSSTASHESSVDSRITELGGIVQSSDFDCKYQRCNLDARCDPMHKQNLHRKNTEETKEPNRARAFCEAGAERKEAGVDWKAGDSHGHGGPKKNRSAGLRALYDNFDITFGPFLTRFPAHVGSGVVSSVVVGSEVVGSEVICWKVVGADVVSAEVLTPSTSTAITPSHVATVRARLKAAVYASRS